MRLLAGKTFQWPSLALFNCLRNVGTFGIYYINPWSLRSCYRPFVPDILRTELLRDCSRCHFRGRKWKQRPMVELYHIPNESRTIVNDDQHDATIYVYLFIPNQLYMFRALSSSIIRSTWLYLQLLVLFTDDAADWCRQ